jgi:hypothetical protein
MLIQNNRNFMIRRELVRIGISEEYLQALTDEQLETLSDGFRMLGIQYEKLGGMGLDTKTPRLKAL